MKILCAVCQRPVEQITLVNDPLRFVTRVVVRCHGQQDECAVPQVLLQDSRTRDLIDWEGVAFERPALDGVTQHAADSVLHKPPLIGP